MKNTNRLYREINVWKRIDEESVLMYRCFLVMPENQYCVQSADFFSLPISESQLKNHMKQFVELLVEDDPEIRSGKMFDSLEEAISAHDNEFS